MLAQLAPAIAIDADTPTIITHPNARYVGWSTVAQLDDGRIVASYSGGRDAHICPFGQVHYIQSSDGGATWTRPRVIVDGPIDDRDSGVIQTRSGAIIVTWFTSMAWKTRMGTEHFDALLPDHRDAWRAHAATVTDAIADADIGVWCIRSTDGGATWSPRIDTLVNSPHGPIELASGALLYPGKRRADHADCAKGSPFQPSIGASISRDDGLTWQWAGDIPCGPDHPATGCHELHGIQAANGDIIVHIRNHNDADKGEILQTVSTDDGATWSTPVSIGVWGYPCHLHRLADDTLISTYSHRRDPRGIRVTFSRDHGQTWTEPSTIATSNGGDMGYPATIQLADGDLYSVWYQRRDDAHITALSACRWRLA